MWAKTSPARSRLPNAALRWTLKALAVNHLPMNAITAAPGVGVEHHERHGPGRRQTTAHRPTRPPLDDVTVIGTDEHVWHHTGSLRVWWRMWGRGSRHGSGSVRRSLTCGSGDCSVRVLTGADDE